jgi:two-component system NtrC family sensor kinase
MASFLHTLFRPAALRTEGGGATLMKAALVVDNNEFYREVLKEALQEEGYQVATAADGIEALRVAADQRPNLVILDLVMPKVDGATVCRQMKADPRYAKTSILVLSGIMVEDIGNLRGIGADAYVAKMPLDRLLPTLRQIVRRLEEGCDETLVDGFDGLFRREVVCELLEEKRFRDLLLASLGEGAAQLDTERRVVTVNPAFAAIVGRDEMDVIDLPIAEVLGLDGDDLERIFGRSGSGERHTVTLGDRTLRLQASPVHRGEQAFGHMLLVEDVTRVVVAEREKDALRRQLTQTEKLSALGQMVAGAAHELNNPLTGVLGYTQLCLERCDPDAPLAADLRKVLQEARRCQKVVENLMAFSRKAVPVRQPESLNALVRATIEAMARDLQAEGVRVDLQLDPDLPDVPLDRTQWTEVLVQLLRNARQAIRRGSRPGRLRVRTAVRDERLALEIEDNGVGIPHEVLPRIFDPFFTTAEVGGGSGLGLSVAYGIVREHQGRILVDGRPGEGARFRVELPAPREAGAARSQAGRSGREAAPTRVLVVDDEPVILDLLVDLLEARGARVETASNGIEALEKLRAAAYDAVVLDMKMPEMGGREVYERLRETNPELLSRVVFSTGDTVSAEARDFFREVSATVIQKPFQLDQVTAALSGFLRPGC